MTKERREEQRKTGEWAPCDWHVWVGGLFGGGGRSGRWCGGWNAVDGERPEPLGRRLPTLRDEVRQRRLGDEVLSLP